MRELLTEIELKISTMNRNYTDEIHIPTRDDPAAAIQDYLNYRQEQRINQQQLQDLILLQDLAQTELIRIEVEAQEKAENIESKARSKDARTETTRVIKQLSKLDLCSPAAANSLLILTKIRR